ncbi:hypothetical protein N499_1016, partial [Wolbachia pipientis wVitA]|jgi:hypothetical protein
MLTI